MHFKDLKFQWKAKKQNGWLLNRCTRERQNFVTYVSPAYVCLRKKSLWQSYISAKNQPKDTYAKQKGTCLPNCKPYLKCGHRSILQNKSVGNTHTWWCCADRRSSTFVEGETPQPCTPVWHRSHRRWCRSFSAAPGSAGWPWTWNLKIICVLYCAV